LGGSNANSNNSSFENLAANEAEGGDGSSQMPLTPTPALFAKNCEAFSAPPIPQDSGGSNRPPIPPSSLPARVLNRDSPDQPIFSSSPISKTFLHDHGSHSPLASPANSGGGGLRTRLRSRAYTRVGSDYYTAPEVELGGGYGTAVDVWSLGVVLYILLCGFPPFEDGEYNDVVFPESHWSDISPAAKDLIRQLLLIDDKMRPTAKETLMHEWISGRQLSVSQTPLPILQNEEFKRFNSKRRYSQMDSFGSFGGGSRSPMLVRFVGNSGGLGSGGGSSISLKHVAKRMNGLQSLTEVDETRERRSSLLSNHDGAEGSDSMGDGMRRRSSATSALTEQLRNTTVSEAEAPQMNEAWGPVSLANMVYGAGRSKEWRDVLDSNEIESGMVSRQPSVDAFGRNQSTDQTQFRLTSVDGGGGVIGVQLDESYSSDFDQGHEDGKRRNIFSHVFRRTDGAEGDT